MKNSVKVLTASLALSSLLSLNAMALDNSMQTSTTQKTQTDNSSVQQEKTAKPMAKNNIATTKSKNDDSDMVETVYFEIDSTDLTDASEQDLENLASELAQLEEPVTIEVVDYTVNSPDASNTKLSGDRVDQIKNALDDEDIAITDWVIESPDQYENDASNTTNSDADNTVVIYMNVDQNGDLTFIEI